MKILVVYDSVFGNTEKIARACGSALEGRSEVSVMRVTEVKPEMLAGLDGLLVGSPTRAFTATPATKAFLKSIPSGSLKGVKVAAFDTRVDITEVKNAFLTFMVNLFGYAAEPIGKALQKKGGVQALPPVGFFVLDKEGPLKDGELERAAAWAQGVVGQ